MFRDALNEKIAHCPFTPEARVNFRQWAARQRRVSAGAMSRLVDQTGGLPVKLDGMTTTCHEQRESPEYVAVRTKLEQYARGEIGVDAILPQPCDAAAISP
jgi:hypothetical protein